MALSPELLKMVSGAKNKYSNNNGKAVKPKEGRNVYRFLAPSSAQAPWVPASGQFWADLGVHWIKADKNGKPLAVVGDVDTVYQRPSEIAAAIEAAIQSAPDEESKELYTEWRARKSVLFNVVDRNNNDDLVPLELTPTTAGKVFDLIEIYAAAGKDIFDPIEGVDIIITKTGKGLNTNYDVAVSPAVPKPLDPSILSKTIDLHEFIKQNFFRGEEQKALNYIGSIAGVAVPTLGASQIGTNTPTAALTSPAASVAHTVEDIPFEPDVLTPAVQPASTAPVAAAPSAAPVVDAEAKARRDAIIKRQQEAAAELAALNATLAAEAPAAPAPVASEPVADAVSAISAAEQDAILAELDGLV